MGQSIILFSRTAKSYKIYHQVQQKLNSNGLKPKRKIRFSLKQKVIFFQLFVYRLSTVIVRFIFLNNVTQHISKIIITEIIF